MSRQIVVGSVLCTCVGAVAAEDRPAIILTGGRVLDPSGERLLDGQELLIVGERIAKIGPAGQISAPPNAIKLDAKGLVILPGLMDLHTHLLLHPYDEAEWDDQVLRESLEFRTIRGTVAARATLQAGFTTIRDLGTEGAGFADVALRDAIKQGLIPGPRIVAVTRAIVATGCYGPEGFDPRWDVPKGAQVADGVDGVRRAVREQIAAGADWVKFYADYRRRPGDRATPTFSQEEINALVDEARSAGLPAVAHATVDEAIRRAVLAGVATIEHGYDVSEEVLTLMRERGVALCPTLAASEAMARYAGWTPDKPDHPRIARMRAMFRRALKSGVTIACGSDVGVFAHGDNAREIELMVELGMTPVEAIRAATSTAARVLGRADDLGRIQEGYIADLIVVDGNPLENIAALRKPVVVVKEGVIVLEGQGCGSRIYKEGLP